jgi:Glycogen recognition site of AMP-activated protein kinase
MGFIMADIYGSKGGAGDEAFVKRIAAPLRIPEHAHPSFEKRLMDKVRAEGPALYPVRATTERSWWRRERVLRVSPLAGLALAAGISAIVVLSTVAVGSRISSNRGPTVAASQPAPATDTVQLVRFVFVDSRASSVELVGDFNEWTKGATKLELSGAPGVWVASVPLSAGRHEYAFIVNGTRWVADPLAVKSSDEFGTESSVIRVAALGKSET